MAQPAAHLRFKRTFFRPKATFSRLLASLRLLFRLNDSLRGADVPPRTTNVPDQSESFPPEIDQLLPADPGALCEDLVDLVRHLRPQLQDGCEWLEQGALEIVGEHPVDAGSVADVWVGMIGDRKVAIKSYRCYASSNYLPTYVRFRKEALGCSRLKDQNIVQLIGVCSIPKLPLALVFEYMEHRNLREYQRNNKDVRKRELLLGISRGVDYLHRLSITHGNLKRTNILIDARGRARVAGLGVAFLRSAMPGVDIDRFFHGAAPELVDPQRFGVTDTGATKASDAYAFGVLAWEVFAGGAPFSDEGGVAGVYSMLSGRRPPRPDDPELSDRLWEMIKGCWESIPSRRKTITDAIVVLDAELNHQ